MYHTLKNYSTKSEDRVTNTKGKLNIKNQLKQMYLTD